MDLMTPDEITAAGLSDWRVLIQGLHARYRTADFGTGARFLCAVGVAGDEMGHQPSVTMGAELVDLGLLTGDAVRREGGAEHHGPGITQLDVDLARRITRIAAEHGVVPDPGSMTVIEIALDTAHSARVAPVWAALLTGSVSAQGLGGAGDDIRDVTGRVPSLWFQDTDDHETPRQRFHLDVWVAPEVAETRIAAAVAAGGVVVDDSEAPSFTVIADPDGNKACVCTSLRPSG